MSARREVEELGRPIVLIDTREKEPLRFSEAVTVETCTLPAGDYSMRGCTDVVALERKRISELAGCCGHDRERFLAQMERLKSYAVRGLIVEGNLGEIVAKWYWPRVKPTSVIGTLVMLHVDWSIPIWFCGDATTAANIVERILIRVHRQRAQVAA